MFDILLGASGGIFGILGALGKNALEIWQAKSKAAQDLAILAEQNRHELAMADKRMAEIELEAKNAVALGEIARLKETDVAAYGAMESSYANDKATYSNAKQSPWMVAVDVVRGLIRPVLTALFSFALIGATLWILTNIDQSVLTQQAFLEGTLYRMVDAFLFLATSAVGWWFAARYSQK